MKQENTRKRNLFNISIAFNDEKIWEEEQKGLEKESEGLGKDVLKGFLVLFHLLSNIKISNYEITNLELMVFYQKIIYLQWKMEHAPLFLMTDKVKEQLGFISYWQIFACILWSFWNWIYSWRSTKQIKK